MDLQASLAGKVEGRLQEVSDCIASHTQLHQEANRKLEQITDNVQSHHRALQFNASITERMDCLEKFMGESADRHQRLLEETHSKMEQSHGKLQELHGRLSGCEVS